MKPLTMIVNLMICLFIAGASKGYLTYKDHQIKANQVICQTYFKEECKRATSWPKSVDECLKQFEEWDQKDKKRHKTEVSEEWSNRCISDLKKVPPARCHHLVALAASKSCLYEDL